MVCSAATKCIEMNECSVNVNGQFFGVQRATDFSLCRKFECSPENDPPYSSITIECEPVSDDCLFASVDLPCGCCPTCKIQKQVVKPPCEQLDPKKNPNQVRYKGEILGNFDATDISKNVVCKCTNGGFDVECVA